MNARYYAVSVSLGSRRNGHPAAMFKFNRDEDGHGYTADVEVWPTGDAPNPLCKHSLWIRQGSPLGDLWVAFDGHEHGCWASTDISGATLNERDLEWAAKWAVQAMKNKHAVTGSCAPQ